MNAGRPPKPSRRPALIAIAVAIVGSALGLLVQPGRGPGHSGSTPVANGASVAASVASVDARSAAQGRAEPASGAADGAVAPPLAVADILAGDGVPARRMGAAPDGELYPTGPVETPATIEQATPAQQRQYYALRLQLTQELVENLDGQLAGVRARTDLGVGTRAQAIDTLNAHLEAQRAEVQRLRAALDALGS